MRGREGKKDERERWQTERYLLPNTKNLVQQSFVGERREKTGRPVDISLKYEEMSYINLKYVNCICLISKYIGGTC